MKHLYLVKFNREKVLTRVKDVINYHRNPVITQFDDDTIKRLKKGFVYTYGYDRKFKPILVIRVDRINFEDPFEHTVNAY